ncbi:glucokinase [Thermosulfurimonas sp.]|uniref:glucokinase n=1 Tax=Thermosulfurimonas sp. TaxID=2080236 RepID=UPI0025FDFFA0|nr:glucokinase [Thermosulfurimonas sp.]
MILAADIGGTRARVALFEESGPLRPRRLRVFSSREFTGLLPLLRRYLAQTGESPRLASLALAGPVLGRKVHLTNLGWRVEASALEKGLGLERVFLLNDLEALAYALPALSSSQVEILKPGRPRGRVCAVVAPGTGLGEAILIRASQGPLVLPTEGGHAEFPPQTEEEWALFRHLRERYGHVSLERVISGPGLTSVGAFFSGRESPPEDIVSRAREGDPAAEKAVRLVARALGREAGSLAVKTLALGGVYLAGGLAPALKPWFAEEFLPAFLDKGRLRSFLEKIPVKLVRHPYAALLGAARYARLSMRISRSVSDK